MERVGVNAGRDGREGVALHLLAWTRSATRTREGGLAMQVMCTTATRGPEQHRAPIRVLVADDHDLIRRGLQAVLAQDPLLDVVGEARNGREAVLMTEELRPDVVLMDVRMPHMCGIDATRALREKYPNTSVLIVSMLDDAAVLREAVSASAAGYVLKTATGEQLRKAVRDAAVGGVPPDRKTLRVSIEQLEFDRVGRPAQGAKSAEPLSPREREVLTLVAGGKTNRAIAEALHITIHTAKAHVDHIQLKLAATDRTQAAVRAMELGYVSSTR
jgi:DNA-binding NarL/FixJ family response regulator